MSEKQKNPRTRLETPSTETAPVSTSTGSDCSVGLVVSAGESGVYPGTSAEFSVDEPMANSSMFKRPSNTAPAFFKREITVAS